MFCLSIYQPLPGSVSPKVGCVVSASGQDVRDIFAERLFILPLGGNFGKDRRFMIDDWKCVGCDDDVTEDQQHVATDCVGYKDIRDKYDLTTDDGLL